MTNKQEELTDGFNADGCLERDGLQRTRQILSFHDRMMFFIGVKRREYIGLNLLLCPFEDKGRKHIARISIVCGVSLDAVPVPPLQPFVIPLCCTSWGVPLLRRAALRAVLGWALELVSLSWQEGRIKIMEMITVSNLGEKMNMKGSPPPHHHAALDCVCEAMYHTGQLGGTGQTGTWKWLLLQSQGWEDGKKVSTWSYYLVFFCFFFLTFCTFVLGTTRSGEYWSSIWLNIILKNVLK